MDYTIEGRAQGIWVKVPGLRAQKTLAKAKARLGAYLLSEYARGGYRIEPDDRVVVVYDTAGTLVATYRIN